VDHVDACLEVSVGWNVLIVGGRRDVVGEAQTVVVILEMHVEQALVCTVERNAPFGHSQQGVKLANVGLQNHNTGVEQIRPSNIRGGREGMWKVKELVRCSVGNNVSIDIHNLSELCLLPEIDLGESGMQVGPVH
jgi:hypothetical protein